MIHNTTILITGAEVDDGIRVPLPVKAVFPWGDWSPPISTYQRRKDQNAKHHTRKTGKATTATTKNIATTM
jgi:hypothetical protein